jgi:cytochrome c-type biogenesis protein CcmE
MTRKRRRLYIVLACAVGLGSATALTLMAFSDNLVFFLSPSQLAAEMPQGGRIFRLGGLVEAGSLHKDTMGGQPQARFRVTDGAAAVDVDYTGILPDLFREGQGVVALGYLRPDGRFRAAEVLAKHDESYMPRDVADALKKSGHWNPGAGPPPPAATWNTLRPQAPEAAAPTGKPGG